MQEIMIIMGGMKSTLRGMVIVKPGKNQNFSEKGQNKILLL